MLQLQLESTAFEARTWLNQPLAKNIPLRWPMAFHCGVRYATAGRAEQLPGNATLAMSFYRAADGLLLFKARSWEVDGQGASATYVLLVDTDTDVLTPIFNADPALDSIEVTAELRIIRGDGTDLISVNDITFLIRRARITGDVRVPMPSSALMQSGAMRLGAATEGDAIVFAQVMQAAPVVDLVVVTPAGSAPLLATIDGEPTPEGFSFKLTDATANADYWLHWTAALLTDGEGVVIPGTALRAREARALAAGEQTVEIDFPELLSGVPILRGLAVQTPTGSAALFAFPIGQPTPAGFTVQLSDAPANADYKIHYDAQVP